MFLVRLIWLFTHNPFCSIYNIDSASKYAVTALTEGLRNELAKFNIKVAGIQPGRSKTNFTASSISDPKLTTSTVAGNKDDATPSSSLVDLYPHFTESLEKRKVEDAKGTHYGSFTPQDVAELLERVLTEREPQLDNMIGAEQYSLFTLKTLLPQVLVDLFVRRAYKA